MTTAKVRREEIYHLAVTTGLTSVEELSERFKVTASTIRRDLAELDRQGRLARTYGGAVPLSHGPELSLRQRIGEAYEQKHAIARWAATQVGDGQTVCLDGGSTVGALAHELQHHQELRVVTAALNIIQELIDSSGIQLECLGGSLRSLSGAFVGPLAEAALQRMSFDAVFLGADAVTAELGLCEADHAQTRLKELMAQRGSRVYVLADASKLGQQPFHAWLPLAPPWTLVTDAGASTEQLEAFRKAGVSVEVVAD